MVDTPFPPFMPPQASPPTQPEQAAKQLAKRPRKKKAQPPASDVMRAEDTVKAPRKKRTPKAHSPKFDLQTILAAASTLKEADMPAFEKTIGLLQDAGKSGRRRLLEALNKVFS